MALSRWSHSAHYIYVCDKDRLQVCLFGHFTSRDILTRYAVIDRRARLDGYDLIERLELYLYLNSWAKHQKQLITYNQHFFLINLLRNLGQIYFYCKGYTDDMPRFNKLIPWKRND